MRKELRQELLRELLKNSKRSDRELAKILGVSQPTVTRARTKLVNEGIIRAFTITPDLARIGYEIMAITVGKFKVPSTADTIEKGTRWMHRFPNIIFASRAEGMGKTAIIISLHKNYSDYTRFIRTLRLTWRDRIEDHDSLVVSLKEYVVKPLSFEYLGKREET